jgi:hypothetical protein
MMAMHGHKRERGPQVFLRDMLKVSESLDWLRPVARASWRALGALRVAKCSHSESLVFSETLEIT